MSSEPISAFQRWIAALAEPGHGRGTRIARITGLNQSYVSRILRGKVKGNPRTETILALAAYMERDPDALMAEIFHQQTSTDRAVPIDTQAELELLRICRDQPGFARRTLDHYQRAKAKGLVELLGAINDLLIEKGGAAAYLEMGRLIERHETKRARARERKRRQN